MELLHISEGDCDRESMTGSDRERATTRALTRVGFLGHLFPFAPDRTTGRLASASFHPLAFPLFLPLLLLCWRQRAGGRKVLRPRLRPQSCWRPRLPQPNGGDEAQASTR